MSGPTADQIEAGAEALFYWRRRRLNTPSPQVTWPDINWRDKATYRDGARKILEAAVAVQPEGG